MATNLTGQCLCGTVNITAQVKNTHVDACHCSMCRRWGGGPLMTIECGSDFTIRGEDAVGVYSSSDWAERGFCRQCGTHLFYRLKANNHHVVPIGLFDNKVEYQFKQQIFIDEKPDYYDFANDTKKMTGAEVFAQFSASE